MESLKLIYNPFSGNKNFIKDLDSYIRVLQAGGFDVSLFRVRDVGDIYGYLEKEGERFDVLLAAGGDGTVGAVVNAMMKTGVNAPLGIIPSGTANDFARHLGFANLTTDALCEVFVERNVTLCDVGLANGEYFINVCGGGLLSQVGHTVDPNMKDILGNMSYYIKGITQIPSFCPIPLRITTSESVIEEEVYLYLIMNSPGAGSFDNIVTSASIQDGLLDFFAVKSAPLADIAKLFIRIIAGEHLDGPSVIHISGKSFKIEALTDDPVYQVCSIDGDIGPDLPLEVSVVPKAIKLLTKSSGKY